MSDIADFTLADLRDALAAKKLSAREAVDAYFTRRSLYLCS